MKKYWKLSTVLLASSVLISSGGVLLANNDITHSSNEIILNEFSNNQQSDNVQIVNSVNDIELISNAASGAGMFAIVKGKTSTEADRLYAWGKNTIGELGVGDTSIHNTPTPVTLPANILRINQVVLGRYHTLLVLENNSIWAAGNNQYGQFGNGKTSTSTEYVTSFKWSTDFFVGKKITSISSGNSHIAVVVNNSEVYTWGANDFGQLGNGTIGSGTHLSVPTLITNTTNGLMTSIGSINDIVCGNNFTFLKAFSSGEDHLYSWGDGSSGQLGFGNKDNVNQPKLLENSLIKGFSSFYVLLNSTFAYNNITGKLYGWGANNDNQLGIATTGYETSPVEVTLPFSTAEKITNIVGANNTGVILTSLGKVYTVGSGQWASIDNGHNKEITIFTELTTVPTTTKLSISGRATLATTEKGIYAWGSTADTYGNGGVFSRTPIPVDPFSTPSLLAQINHDNAKTAQDVAKEIYSASVFNETTFKSYIDETKFPAGTTFKMTSTPVADALKGEIKCTVLANKSYSKPDGAKVITDAPFEITLTGFKVLADSMIMNTTLTADTKYNLNNIENAMKLNGTSNVNMATFNDLFTAANFDVDNKFTITTSTIDNGIYKATLNASKAQVAGYVVENKPYDITIEGLKSQPDSTVIVKVDAKDQFNANNIVKAINPASNGTVDLGNLKLIAEITNFPTDNIFTVSNDTVVDGTYNATLSASKYYLGGNVTAGPKAYSLQVINLASQPDSAVTVKADAKDKFNANNIVRAINPTGSGAVSMTNLNSICNIGNFPSDNIFTISNDTVVAGTYNATLSASKYYLGGNMTTGPKTYSLQVINLASQPDSIVTVKTDAKDKFNANNIVHAINPEGKGNVDLDNLKLIANVSNFPADNIFTISNDIVASGVYNAIITASKYYLGGNLMTVPKTYPIQVTGLTDVINSNVIVKENARDYFNANNIVKAINPDGNGVINLDNLLLICDVLNFPTGSTLTICDDKVEANVYSATLNTTKYYLDGNLFEVSKDFTIQVSELQLRPNSSVIAKTPATDELNEIIDKLIPGELIDNVIFDKLINIGEFPDGTTFTIDTVIFNEEESIIEFSFTPDKIYRNGNIETNSVSLDGKVQFVFPVEPTTDNTGLIIGLSVGGVLLLLILIGLLIWYLRRRSSGSRHSKFSVQEMFYGVNSMFTNIGQRLSSGISYRPSHRKARRTSRPHR